MDNSKAQVQADALYLFDAMPSTDGGRTEFDQIREAESGLLLSYALDTGSYVAWVSANRIIPFIPGDVEETIYSRIVTIEETKYFFKPCTSWSPAVFGGIADSFLTLFEQKDAQNASWVHAQMLDLVCTKLQEILDILQEHTKQTMPE